MSTRSDLIDAAVAVITEHQHAVDASLHVCSSTTCDWHVANYAGRLDGSTINELHATHVAHEIVERFATVLS